MTIEQLKIKYNRLMELYDIQASKIREQYPYLPSSALLTLYSAKLQWYIKRLRSISFKISNY